MRKLRTIEMHRLSVEEFKEAEKLPLIVVLDDVRSLYNVGSVFRSCDAFRVEAVYLRWSIPPSILQTLQLDRDKRYAVIFGNEVKGVKQAVVDMSDGCLEIPQFGTKHSLNVSVTAGIVVWEFAKKMKLQS
jgi:23S rRNA (guanosine2251-2'-O)-methyltransferase